MKSNICKIEDGVKDLEAIFKESEKVAVYNELSNRQANQLRQLCEELDGMLPHIINNFSGDFWIEFEQGVCKVNVSIERAQLNNAKKEELISIAKDKKNAAAVGISGKIRTAIESFFLADENPKNYLMVSGMYDFVTGSINPIDYRYLCSLKKYMSSVSKDEQAEQWDELEKSLIASIADDVIVGIKGTKVDIVIVKNFA